LTGVGSEAKLKQLPESCCVSPDVFRFNNWKTETSGLVLLFSFARFDYASGQDKSSLRDSANTVNKYYHGELKELLFSSFWQQKEESKVN
jgi:hypothetical protein